MPCDTPPPPPPVEDDCNVVNDEEPDDSMYEVIDLDELEDMPVDDSIVTFHGHTDSVFCCNFDRTGHYIVTGGQDDKALVWSVLDKSIKFECTGHSDSVIAANFSPDSKYVATADMNGLIQVWDVNEGTLVWNFETYEVTWSEWLRGANILIAGSVDGSCWQWSIPDGATEVFEHTGAACSIGCISHNDEKLATGYSDGTLKFWNISDHTLQNTITGSVAHKGAVTTVRYSVDDSLILTGSEDGTAKLIKASDFKVLWNIDCRDSSQENNVSVESVGFCHIQSYIVTGTNGGSLSIWDTRTKTRRHNVELDCAIVKVICDEFAPIVYAAIGDGILQAHDIRTGVAVKQWNGHNASLFDLAISSDRSLFLTASEDYSCKIFERGIF